MKNISIFVLLAGLVGLGSVSCEPEYDTPPIATIPEGNLITIDTLWHWYADGGSQSITEDYSLYGVVTTDESSGAFYKEVYIQDGTRGIRLRLTSSSTMSIGDSVRVYLKGTYLDNYNELIQLDSVDPDENIIIQSNGNEITPLNLSITDLSAKETIGTTDFYTYQSMFIELNNVEFAQTGVTWADAVNQFSVNHDLNDCNSGTVLVRASGYSNYAGDVVPEGNGTFLGIMGVFGTDIQMYARTPDELDMNGNRCGFVSCSTLSAMSETFAAFTNGGSAGSQCWETVSTIGSAVWTIGDISGDQLAVATNVGSGDASNEMWLISPEITFASSNSLSFQTAVSGWNHDGLEAYILTNYSGNPNSATQTQITSATIAGSSSGNNTLVSSGSIAISSLISSGPYHIAFKYNASGISGETSAYKVDNVILTQ
ncbi:DUF5689 domain-containing protein [Parvicella tangerina]|uniref:DUF5689 domain-containing protein n=1 Tax=Parvicella tangerina TaxID=2829795 RepID=A0A916JLF7_9FLAO|nr:DUF5689 domain-containing protein [Parvicella tangerina]CAG5078891.1 hypothetical protein CRYO30217_00799 [Parvicella tangerina]